MFKIEFATDNSAFEEGATEIGRILRKIAAQIEQDGICSGPIHDINGNRVGSYGQDLASPGGARRG